MLKIESFFKSGKIPPYNSILADAFRLVGKQVYDDGDVDTCNDGGDYAQAAIENASNLFYMAYQSSLDELAYRQWWIDFIVCQYSNQHVTIPKYPELGCDGDLRFDYIKDPDNDW